jgi:hypothetical protein
MNESTRIYSAHNNADHERNIREMIKIIEKNNQAGDVSKQEKLYTKDCGRIAWRRMVLPLPQKAEDCYWWLFACHKNYTEWK